MRVLLLSAYAAASHQYWVRTITHMLPDWEWRVLELPPRHFSWRVRGNPLFWSQQERAALESPTDLILATSMVDLATLRGLVPALAATPAALYFHENQFAYPDNASRHGQLEAQMVSLYAALAAQRLLFNSAHNRDSFLFGLDRLLARLPDKVPPGIVAQLSSRAQVLPVPLMALAYTEPATRPADRPWHVVWNHRWEYDKGPDHLLAFAEALASSSGVLAQTQLSVVGQCFRQRPEAFEALPGVLGERLVHFGFVDDERQYRALLSAADVVLSTALHDFQGLSVLEALAAGCMPLVPDRLAYRDYFPDAWRHASHPDKPAAEAAAAVERLQHLTEQPIAVSTLRAQVASLSTETLAPRYRQVLLDTVAG